jgi:TatD DNase family protein
VLPLDAHAHIVPDIAPAQLGHLNACVFAMTRSLEEFEGVADRADPITAWGVGCHPALAKAQRAFSVDVFSRLMAKTAVVGEVGLDGSSRVPMEKQREVFSQVLAASAQTPRLVSVHSYRAAREALDELEAHQPLRGVILHWWLGDPEQTLRAVRLGCWFSVNPSSIRHAGVIDHLPLDQILAETDHPYGDRYVPGSRPGAVSTVESALARRYERTPEAVRTLVWRNLSRLVTEVGCSNLLPRSIRSHLATIN